MKIHPKMKRLYVGIDCHKRTHTASIVNCFNEPLGTISFDNDKLGFQSLVNLVDKVLNDNVGTTPIFGLEDVKHFGHSLCTYLLSRNYLVKYVNSSLTFSERKNNPIINKTDELDSLCIAKILLNNFDTLPNAQNDEIFWTLKQLVTMRQSLMESYHHYKNKLHSQLLHHYPNYHKMFKNIDCQTAFLFFAKYPSPDKLEGITEDMLYNDISVKSVHTRRKVHLIITAISEYDIEANIYQEERNFLIQQLIKQLQDIQARKNDMEEEIVLVYDKIGYTLHTMIGFTKVSAAVIVAEIGNIDRFQSSSQLARYSGIAPNSFSSGNSTKFVNNKYGNRRLNALIYYLAVRNICPGTYLTHPLNGIFLEYFNKKVSEGKTKKQALVCVMRRLVNIIYGVLKNRTEYIHPQELEKQRKAEYFIRASEKIANYDKTHL